MPYLNKVFLIGNITNELEVRYTSDGRALVDFGLGLNRKWRAKDGSIQEETTFVDVTFWAKAAETLAQYARKGDPLFVEGRLKLDTWRDGASGQKRRKLRVIGENFQFLKSREGAGASASQGEDDDIPF